MQHVSPSLTTKGGAARKFFVTSVKDLSTGVKYMDSKVDFWLYLYRCQVYGFQSGVLILFVPGGGGGGGQRGGKMCRSTMRRRGRAKCVEVLCIEIFTN